MDRLVTSQRTRDLFLVGVKLVDVATRAVALGTYDAPEWLSSASDALAIGTTTRSAMRGTRIRGTNTRSTKAAMTMESMAFQHHNTMGAAARCHTRRRLTDS